MIAIMVFIGATVLALLAGFGSLQLGRRYALWISIPATIISALFTALVSAAIYLITVLKYPANDERVWSALNKIELMIDTSQHHVPIDERAVSSPSTIVTPFGTRILVPSHISNVDSDYTVDIRYPENERTDCDVTLVLTIRSRNGVLPNKELSATIYIHPTS